MGFVAAAADSATAGPPAAPVPAVVGSVDISKVEIGDGIVGPAAERPVTNMYLAEEELS